MPIPEDAREAFNTAHAIIRAAATGDGEGVQHLVTLLHERKDADEMVNVINALAVITGDIVRGIDPAHHAELWSRIEERLRNMDEM